jgi:hypothetical protein
VKTSVAFQNALLELGLIFFVVLIVGGVSYWFGDTRGSSDFVSFQARAQDAELARGAMRTTLQFRKKRCNFQKVR